MAGAVEQSSMCNLYSVITNQEAVRNLFGVTADNTGNLPTLPAIAAAPLAPVRSFELRQSPFVRFVREQPKLVAPVVELGICAVAELVDSRDKLLHLFDRDPVLGNQSEIPQRQRRKPLPIEADHQFPAQQIGPPPQYFGVGALNAANSSWVRPGAGLSG